MSLHLLAFLTSFCFVALKATQQLNVVHGKYLWVLPTSFLMATCEVFIVVQSAHNGWGWIVLPIGAGSGLGAMCSMWMHERIRNAK